MTLDITIILSVMTIISIYAFYSLWVKALDKIEEDEFITVKGIWSVNPKELSPSSFCPICAERMDLQKTQKVMFINNMPEVCCIRHTAREMTDYIKERERGKKIETTNN